MDMISELHIFNNLCTNPTETSYYDISLSDSEKVITYLTFYTAQDGKEIRSLGEAFDSYSKDFYGRNSVYLTAGVPYNAEISCNSDEETVATGNISFSISKSKDSIYERNAELI